MANKIHQLIDTLMRSHNKKRTPSIYLGFALASISFVVFFVQRQNYLLDNMHAYNADEIHTVHEATKTRPFSYRVGEGTRLLAKFLFPATLIYMNKHLGGDHYTEGWSYPGLGYFKSRFNQPDMIKNGIGDPGLQDFFYFMRLQYAALFALVATLFSLFLFYRENDRISPFIITVYLGGSFYLLREQGWFYVDPLLLMMFFVGFFFLYAATKEDGFSPYARKPSLLAFWYVFTVSVKLSAAFLLIIPITIIFYPKRGISRKVADCFKFLWYSVFFLVLTHIAIFVKGWREIGKFIDENAANFWHYAVGHRHMDPTGWPHAEMVFRMLREDFGILVYLFIPVCLASFYLADGRTRVIKAVLFFIFAATVFSLTEQRIFLHRNIVPFYGFFLILVSTGLWEIYKKCPPRHSKAFLWATVILLSTDRAYALRNSPWDFYKTLSTTQRDAVTFFKQLREERGGTSYSVSIDTGDTDPYHQRIEEVPLLSHATFADYEKQWKDRASGHNGVIIVRRTGRNFQLTNFILPRLGLKNRRFGHYFVFFHPQDEE